MTWITEINGQVKITVRVRTGAPRPGFVCIQGDELLINVDARPEAGKANLALIKFLAKEFKIPSSQVNIISGHKAKSKTILITGVEMESIEKEVLNRLQE